MLVGWRWSISSSPVAAEVVYLVVLAVLVAVARSVC
jgi:hypothetical protein